MKQKKGLFLAILLLALLMLSISLSAPIAHLGMRIGIKPSVAFVIPYIVNLLIWILCVVSFFILKLKLWIKLLSILTLTALCASIVYVINPYYPEDFENRVTELSSPKYPIDELLELGTHDVYCFFLTECEFCKKASEVLETLHQKYPEIDIQIYFYCTAEYLPHALADKNITISASNIDNDSFFKLAGNSFPVIILPNEDGTISYWSGNDVNYTTFDEVIIRNSPE